MKVLDSFTLYYDLSETDKLERDKNALKERGWNYDPQPYLENGELKGYYLLVFTEIDGFVPEDCAGNIINYIFR